MNKQDIGQENHVHAIYQPQRIARYMDNPLIEALPPSPTDDKLVDALTLIPDFNPKQREWPTHERLQQVAGLSNFMVPLSSHIQLARTLDSMMREGYVGRVPRTASHVKVLQKLYENQKNGHAFSQQSTTITAQLSTSLLGPSGMGKTTVVKRVTAMTPSVIYHEKLNIWQIPYLHIETPHDGASVKGLAHSILRKIDLLIPQAKYYETYALAGKASVEMLMNHCARILHIHLVGMLVLDEIQNLENSPKGKQALMTMLVSASNELGVPILFIGTNKANRTLNLDFRQARRSIGHGGCYWDRLHASTDPSQPGEWEDMLEVLWTFQWIKKPVPLTSHIMAVMYHHTQGVIDLVIKLFAACQWRAMLSGSETIDVQLIDDVAKKELVRVQPMVEALRRGDLAALQNLPDIAPFNLDGLLQSATMKFNGSRVKGASIRTNDINFVPTVANAIRALGFDDELAESAAKQVASEATVLNVFDGTQAALEKLQPPKKLTSKGKKKSIKTKKDYPPGDYRLAINIAKQEHCSISAALKQMGAMCDISETLHI